MKIVSSIFALVITLLLDSSPVFALVNLKQVEVKDGNELSLSFDGGIKQSQVEVEYIKDIIQISLSEVGIYPAKMTQVHSDLIEKVFTYQYSPHVVRCRITVKGQADEFKNRFELVTQDRGIRVSFRASEVASVQEKETDLDEKQLLDRVIRADQTGDRLKAKPGDSAPSVADAQKVDLTLERRSAPEKPMLTGGNVLPSVKGAFAKMGLFLLVLGVIAWVLKNAKKLGTDANRPGWLGTLKRLAKNGLGKEPHLIQILSTQYLGPKKSLMVVKISGKTLVLGVTHESIHLITQISGADDTPEDSEDLTEFKEILKEEDEKPESPVTEISSARSRIKNRLEGLKPL